jgi:hypothetical protein
MFGYLQTGKCYLAIDPGPEKSGVVLYDKEIKRIVGAGVLTNTIIRQQSKNRLYSSVLIEFPDAVSPRASASVSSLAFEVGRFFEYFHLSMPTLIGRSKVKKNAKCKNDTQIRAYLKNKYEKEYCNKLANDSWQAFALIDYWISNE